MRFASPAEEERMKRTVAWGSLICHSSFRFCKMANRHSLLKISHLAILVPVLALFCLLISFTSLFQYLELKSYDILLRLSPNRPVAERVIVVGIDDRSIAALGRLPWDRRVISRLIDQINAGHPSAIGVDLFFDVPTETRADIDLAQSIRHSGKVVFPAALVSAQPTTNSQAPLTHWLFSLPVFEPAVVGHVNASPDSDGICRRICLSWTARGQRFWAFGLEIFRLASGLAAIPPLEKDTSFDLGGMTVPARRADGYQVLLHYSDSAAPIPVLSAMDVLSDRWNADIVEGKAVLIGTVSPLEGDRFFTPTSTAGQPMPGILVHANVVNLLFSKSFLTQASLPLSLAVLILIIGVVLFLMQWGRAPWQWIGTAVVVAIIITAVSLIFWYWQYVLPLPTLLFASLTATAVFHVQRLATVRVLLRRETYRLARQLPVGANEAHLL
jgi:CHASE2 domain-containing sensor protein